MTAQTPNPIKAVTGPQTVLITGASRGLGRSMTEHLVQAGHTVIGTFRSREEEALAVANSLADAPGSVHFLPYDAQSSDPQEFARKAAGLAPGGKIDALIPNAGIGVYSPFLETTPEQFDDLIGIQIRGPFFLTQAIVPHMSEGGRILFVSSGLARFTLPGYAAYASAKGAIEVLTRYLAVEFGQRGIRVNCLAPGAIETDFTGGAVRDNQELNAAVASMIPLGRAGKPDDIGAAVAALLSDGMQWMNGARIEISGGQKV